MHIFTQAGIVAQSLTSAFLVVLVLVSGPSSPAQSQLLERDEVVRVPNTNREMTAAIKRARETLPVFFKFQKHPQTGQANFALKVAISDGSIVEHFWLTRIRRKGGRFSGIIDNRPNDVKTVRQGQRFSFPRKEISDWMFVENGKIIGGFTIRVLLDLMPPDDAARLRGMLAYQPK